MSARDALPCRTDIDPTGAYLPKKDMTAGHLIALLGAMLIVDGRGIIAGTPGQSSTSLLDHQELDLATSEMRTKVQISSKVLVDRRDS